MDMLADMNIEQKEGSLQVNFPRIREENEIAVLGNPAHFSARGYGWMEEQVTKMSSEMEQRRYFSHQSEESDLPTLGVSTPFNKYTDCHPDKVALLAFSKHAGYRVTPEDIGAQILLDFAEYVSQNKEKCAPLFNGKLDQKRDIKVWLEPGESVKDLDVLVNSMRTWKEGVLSETDSKIRNVLHPEFSRPNKIIDVVYSGLLMGAAKEFVDYSMSTRCGIPHIRVEGSRQDWEQIRAMVAGLGDAEPLSELRPFYDWVNSIVLEGITGLYDGKEDPVFWGSMFKHKSISGPDGMSGGWLPSLNIYETKGKILSLEDRWTRNGSTYQTQHIQNPVTNIQIISDNSVGIGNIDPDLSVNIGFTSTSYRNNQLKPVLGIEGYVSEEKNPSTDDN